MVKEKNLIAGKEIKSCPFCGKDEGVDSYDEEKNRVVCCMNCGAVGPWAEYLSYAIESWNERFVPKKENFSKDCEKRKYLKELYERTPKTNRDYWLMTELFVLLHGSDVCNKE